VVHNEGQEQLISIGAHRMYAYDVSTGKELWFCDHPGFSNVAQPVFSEGMVYMSTGFGKADLWAVRADGAGDVTKTHVAWRFKKGTPCRSTPLIHLFADSDSLFHGCDTRPRLILVWTNRL